MDGWRTEPVVHPQVWHKIPHGHVGPAESVAKVGKGTGGNGKTNIGKDNVLGVLVVKDGGSGIEVIDAAAGTVLLALAAALTLTLVEVVASDIGHEVFGPANELLAKEVQQGIYGSLFAKLAELVYHTSSAGGMLLAGSGQKNHVALHVSGSLVVGAVGELPAEIWDKKSGVKKPAGQIIDES
jgi:hypothetical protein